MFDFGQRGKGILFHGRSSTLISKTVVLSQRYDWVLSQAKTIEGMSRAVVSYLFVFEGVECDGVLVCAKMSTK